MKKIIYIIIITLIIVGLIYTKIKENKYEEIKIEETNINNIEEKENELIKIHIAGAVILPGVIELNEGSRITDAIEMAGGLAEEANIRKINLAKKIEDGEKIYILYIGEDISDIIDEEIDISNANSKVNINTATQTELELLTGIGPSTALKIIQYRKANGKFKNIEEIKNIDGIGEAVSKASRVEAENQPCPASSESERPPIKPKILN